jgi:hypothetical protein
MKKRSCIAHTRINENLRPSQQSKSWNPEAK